MGGDEPRLKGRLAPEDMFPAARPDLRTRRHRLANGISLRVVEAGELTSRPVLLVHGWGASVYMWRDWFTPMAAMGYRAIAIDLPGHGLSDKPEDSAAYRCEGLAAAVRSFMQENDLMDADIVAQSMGGSIAFELIASNPQITGRMAFVNPSFLGRVRHERLFRAISPSVVDRVLPRLVARWIIARAHRLVYGDPSRITERDEDEYWAPSQFPSYARAMRRLLHAFNWTRGPAEQTASAMAPHLKRILIILGGKDRLVLDAESYVARISKRVSGLQVALVPDGGHAVNEELPGEVIDIVRAFFANTAV